MTDAWTFQWHEERNLAAVYFEGEETGCQFVEDYFGTPIQCQRMASSICHTMNLRIRHRQQSEQGGIHEARR